MVFLLLLSYVGGSINWAPKDGLFHGKSHLEMDDDWGYPDFRKPPFVLLPWWSVLPMPGGRCLRGALPTNQDPGGGEMPAPKRMGLTCGRLKGMVAVFLGHLTGKIHGNHLRNIGIRLSVCHRLSICHRLGSLQNSSGLVHVCACAS